MIHTNQSHWCDETINDAAAKFKRLNNINKIKNMRQQSKSTFESKQIQHVSDIDDVWSKTHSR